jgi:hypothetical protein
MCPCAKDSEDPVRKINKNGKIERMAGSVIDGMKHPSLFGVPQTMSNCKWHQSAPDLAALLIAKSVGRGPEIGFSEVLQLVRL